MHISIHTGGLNQCETTDIKSDVDGVLNTKGNIVFSARI